jgi:hypothetical protein
MVSNGQIACVAGTGADSFRAMADSPQRRFEFSLWVTVDRRATSWWASRTAASDHAGLLQRRRFFAASVNGPISARKRPGARLRQERAVFGSALAVGQASTPTACHCLPA